MATQRIPNDVVVQGNLTVTGTLPTIARSVLEQNTIQYYMIAWEAWRVHDAYQTTLPGAPATDDLGLIGGTFGSATPSIQTEDLKAAGATNKYARAVVYLPPEYDTGKTVQIAAQAGMLTTIADVTATIDFEVYKSDKEAGVDGADLCATAAQSINSVTLAEKTFAVTATSLAPGDALDIRMTLAINDAATGTTVKGIVGYVALQCDIKG